MRRILLYLQVAFYGFMGAMHLAKPAPYLAMMPTWLPAQMVLIYGSGLVEVLLACLLIPLTTRRLAALAIIAMLIGYLVVIHIPQTIGFYQTGNAGFGPSLGRIAFQFVLITWAYWYTADKPLKA